MAQETAYLTQKATLWSAALVDDYGAYKVSGTPVEINVRWESSISDSDNPTDTDTQTGIDVMVDRQISIGSVMRYGHLLDVPVPPNNLYKVMKYDETPDVKGREFQRNVTLAKLSNQLPTIG